VGICVLADAQWARAIPGKGNGIFLESGFECHALHRYEKNVEQRDRRYWTSGLARRSVARKRL